MMDRETPKWRTELERQVAATGDDRLRRVAPKHRAAMTWADRAEAARLRLNVDPYNEELKQEFVALSRQALLRERMAADELRDAHHLEPSRSVLYRSAAYLALDCGDTNEARRLAKAGLEGAPPLEVADEIREILESCDENVDETRKIP